MGDFTETHNSVVNISGGTVGRDFRADSESVVNIIGSQFSIDDTPISNLQPEQTVTIYDRDGTLSGVLADGTPFSFDLNPFIDGYFRPDATLTVTLVEPTLLLGDVDMNGEVNFFDIQPFIDVLASQQFQAEADIDRNGVVNFFDIQPFIDILAGTN